MSSESDAAPSMGAVPPAAPAGETPEPAPKPLGWARPTAARGPSDTVGTGSSCAIGCTVLMVMVVLIGIAVFAVLRLT